jgi:hypothetical protein
MTATHDPSVKIELWNPVGTQLITTLATTHNDADKVPYEVEFTKNEHGDYAASFKLKREARAYFPDLADSNRVKIKVKSDRDWVGDIESVARDVSESSVYAVSCVGPQARLKQNGTTADRAFDLAPNEKASTYITDHIVADSYLGMTAGTLTDTFQFITGYEWYPGRNWAEILDELCKYQLNRWYVDKDYRLHFVPRDTVPSYQVFMADCKQTHLDKARETVRNWVQVAYTPDGVTYGYVTAQDTVSQGLHGMRRAYEQLSNKGTPTEAQGWADTYIALKSKLKPSSSLPADIIYDANRAPVFPEEVEGGKILYIPDLLSAEESNPQTINEMCTWALAEVKWKDGYVSLSPGDQPTELDVLGAQWGLRDKAMGL